MKITEKIRVKDIADCYSNGCLGDCLMCQFAPCGSKSLWEIEVILEKEKEYLFESRKLINFL